MQEVPEEHAAFVMVQSLGSQMTDSHNLGDDERTHRLILEGNVFTSLSCLSLYIRLQCIHSSLFFLNTFSRHS